MHTRKAKEYRMLNLEQLGEAEYTLLKHMGMLWEYFPEASGNYGEDMERIDTIDQYRVSGDDNPNGNNIKVEYTADEIEKLYDCPKDGMFVDDYEPNGSNSGAYVEGEGCRGHDMISDPTSPSHYEIGNTGLEAIDVIQATLTKEEFIGYCRGNLLKYHLRSHKKNGTEDLQKADVYSGWLVAELEGEG